MAHPQSLATKRLNIKKDCKTKYFYFVFKFPLTSFFLFYLYPHLLDLGITNQHPFESCIYPPVLGLEWDGKSKKN